jgi:hypothetical protein
VPAKVSRRRLARSVFRGNGRRIANAPETQQIITSLVNAQLALMCELFDDALVAIRQALQARRKAISKGEVIDLGPDHCEFIDRAA